MKMKLLFTLAVVLLFSSCAVNNQNDLTGASGKTNEVLVDLKDGIDASEFAATKSLKKYKLVEQKKVSPGMNIVLFSFDSGKIEADALIVKLKAMDAVEDAQTNKVITPR